MAVSAILDFGKNRLFDFRNVFYGMNLTCIPILVKIGHAVMKWQRLFEIQDGVIRHLGF